MGTNPRPSSRLASGIVLRDFNENSTASTFAKLELQSGRSQAGAWEQEGKLELGNERSESQLSIAATDGTVRPVEGPNGDEYTPPASV